MSIVPSLVAYCAPTLASIKAGSLFGFVPEDWDAFRGECEALSVALARKGLALRAVQTSGHRALVYVYRPGQLCSAFAEPDARRFLLSCGYAHPEDAEAVVDRLCEKLRSGEPFPHEIGLFLGYPLADVLGFIRNRGQNCLVSGVWKAYSDVPFACRAFERIRKCVRIYRRLFAGGRTLEQLTVAA